VHHHSRNLSIGVGRFPKTANQKTITRAVWISMPLGAMRLSAQLYAMEAELWKGMPSFHRNVKSLIVDCA